MIQARSAQQPAGRPHRCGRSRADHQRDLAEVGVGQTRHQVGEVGVIEDIEEVVFERLAVLIQSAFPYIQLQSALGKIAKGR